MAEFIRIPEDPPDCDLEPCSPPRCCTGCSFYGLRFDDCPKARASADRQGLACHPSNRPDSADVIYVRRKIYGNEEN